MGNNLSRRLDALETGDDTVQTTVLTSMLIDKDDSGRATRVRFGDEVVPVPDGVDPDEFARRHAREHYGDRHVIHVRFVKPLQSNVTADEARGR